MQEYTPRPKEKAIECIEGYILEHGLKAYDALPPEREMCEMWGMNRTTLRSAIASLQREGRLFSKQGSATRLAPRFRRTLQDLQGFSEYAASCGLEATTRLLSFSKVECDKHLAAEFKRVLGTKLYRISRLRILNDMPMLIETAYIPVDMAPGLEEHDFVTGSLFEVLKNVYGLHLDHGLEKASLTSATDEEARHLGVERGEPLFWIVSSTEDPQGNIVEYCRSVARTDVVEMASVMVWDDGKEEK